MEELSMAGENEGKMLFFVSPQKKEGGNRVRDSNLAAILHHFQTTYTRKSGRQSRSHPELPSEFGR